MKPATKEADLATIAFPGGTFGVAPANRRVNQSFNGFSAAYV
jgi:hypothetical protein